MKRYKVSLHVTQEINADDIDEALSIFWDDLHINSDGQELAHVEEIKA